MGVHHPDHLQPFGLSCKQGFEILLSVEFIGSLRAQHICYGLEPGQRSRPDTTEEESTRFERGGPSSLSQHR